MISLIARSAASRRLAPSTSRRCRSNNAAEPSHLFRSRAKFAELFPDQIVPASATLSSDQLKAYLEHVAKSLKISSLEDWYRVTSRDFAQAHDKKTRSFLEASGITLHQALQKAYPEHIWELWRFKISPRGFWTEPESVKQFFEKLRNGQPIDVLYNLSTKEIVGQGGQGLMQHTGFSVLQALQIAYPDHVFEPHKFKIVPKHHWENIDNQRVLFDNTYKQLQFKDMEEWYMVSIATLRKLKVWGVIGNYYSSSLYRALCSIYPDHQWDATRFVVRPTTPDLASPSKTVIGVSSESPKREQMTHQQILLKVGEALGIAKTPDEMESNFEKWYPLTEDKFDSIKVKALRFKTWLKNNYSSSLSRALVANFPHFHWEIWRFANVSPGFWDNKQNQLKFLVWAQSKLSIKSLDGWYSVSVAEFTKIEGGSSLLAKYSTLSEAVMTIFPDHSWEVWKFSPSKAPLAPPPKEPPQVDQVPIVPQSSSSSPNPDGNVLIQPAPLSPRAQRESDPHYAIRGFMQDIGKRLGVQQLDDWYRVSVSQLGDAGANHILVHYGGLSGVLKVLYPGHKWNNKVFTLAAKRAVQRQLRIRLEALFPGHEVVEEFNLGLKFLRKDRYIGFDAYVPALKLAFEYQGEVHFKDIQSVGQRDIKRDNDMEKAAVCARQGIKLVEVPYTWDSEEASLVALIRQIVPELLKDWQPKIAPLR